MNKHQLHIISFDSRYAGFTRVCLALRKSNSKADGSVAIRKKLLASISTFSSMPNVR